MDGLQWENPIKMDDLGVPLFLRNIRMVGIQSFPFLGPGQFSGALAVTRWWFQMFFIFTPIWGR